MRREHLQRILAQSTALVRVLDLDSGEEQLIDPTTDASDLSGIAAQLIAQDSTQTLTHNGRRLFLSVYSEPCEIVIVGAVHIAQALSVLATAAGYRVRIIDPRPPYGTDERFAGVEVHREWPDEALARRPLTARSALIALAHDPKLDDAGLAAAIRSPAFYIGALGSTRTHAKRLTRLSEAGYSETESARIRGPVGLAIGARSPAEIAIAILAEVIQVWRVPKPKVAGVVMAAGAGTRMGGAKLSLPVKGKPLVRHAAEAALAAGLDPIVVVTGSATGAVETALAGLPLTFAHNDHYAEGLSTSLRTGIRALPEACEGAVVLLGDMPAISSDLIQQVYASFDPNAGRAICVAKSAGGLRGHPVLWARRYFPELMALCGDQGAKSLMTKHANHVVEIQTHTDAPIIDIDTPADLAAYID